jgi:hypothetical protein
MSFIKKTLHFNTYFPYFWLMFHLIVWIIDDYTKRILKENFYKNPCFHGAYTLTDYIKKANISKDH